MLSSRTSHTDIADVASRVRTYSDMTRRLPGVVHLMWMWASFSNRRRKYKRLAAWAECSYCPNSRTLVPLKTAPGAAKPTDVSRWGTGGGTHGWDLQCLMDGRYGNTGRTRGGWVVRFTIYVRISSGQSGFEICALIWEISGFYHDELKTWSDHTQ